MYDPNFTHFHVSESEWNGLVQILIILLKLLKRSDIELEP